MTTLELPQQDTSFRQAVWTSFVLHGLIILFFSIKTVFFSGEPLNYQAAIRVDIVDLPDKAPPAPSTEPAPAIKEAPQPPPPLPKKEIVKKETKTINLDKTKSKEKAAIDKLKALAALEKIKDDVTRENQKKAASRLYKGNQLSSGTELRGLTRLEHDNYIADVEKHIRQNWALPEWLAQKNLKAQVKVRFDAGGNIISKQMYHSSGNPSFDEIVMETVQKSSPVPPPPEKFVQILANEGMLIGFPE